jgi:VanZ family protein
MRCKLCISLLLLGSIATTSAWPSDSVYLFRDEFTDAGRPRYTFTGSTPRRVTQIQAIPTIAIGAAYTGLFLVLQAQMSSSWWQRTGSFNIQEDGDYAQYVDKAGHFFTGFTMSTIMGDALMESGFSYETSTWLGAALGLAYMTTVEIQDGYATTWGFSPSDQIANTAGAVFYAARNLVPDLQNVTPRWSYVPGRLVGERMTTERPLTIFDDYNSTIFWLNFNVENMLPRPWAEYWPDWMTLSVGYGCRDYEVRSSLPDGPMLPVRSRAMIGIDYDWLKILPESRFGVLNYVRQALNYIRLPGPTLEFSDAGVRFAVLYPFAVVVPF